MLRRSPLLAPRRENLGESGQGAAHIDEIAPLPTHVFKSYVVDVEAHGLDPLSVLAVDIASGEGDAAGVFVERDGFQNFKAA